MKRRQQVYDKNNLAIVAIVMNYYTDEVLNVTEVKVPEDPSSVRPVALGKANEEIRIALVGSNNLQVTTLKQNPFVLDILTIDGRQVNSLVGEGGLQFSLPQHGLYLLRITQNGRVWTKKVAI